MTVPKNDDCPFADDPEVVTAKRRMHAALIARSFMAMDAEAAGYCTNCNHVCMGPEEIQPELPIDTIVYRCVYCGSVLEMLPPK